MYKHEMKFHMLMFMNAWMMLVLMKCKCQMQCLTLGCYIRWLANHLLLIEESLRLPSVLKLGIKLTITPQGEHQLEH